MQATQKEMAAARLPLEARDFCAHLLIPLNECRKAAYWAPWACKHERHLYEGCQARLGTRRARRVAHRLRRLPNSTRST